MDNCPACGATLVSGCHDCPSCGRCLDEITESFPPVGEGETGAETIPSEGPLLVVRKGPEVGERFYIDRATLTIGRDPGSDIFLNDITVSRHHASLERVGEEVSVSDAGSLNGTYVNGVTVDRALLRTGDAVQIGRFQMVFLSGGGV
ncbi:MAG: FHA domain-containing protein [Coriobacteriia bacterium]|nr:FHA domain-containing protein [Coriobacteriia bacterium]